MKIRTKVILFFTAFTIFFVAVAATYLGYFVRKSFKEEAISNLQVIKERNVGVYTSFLDGMKTRALDWSLDLRIRELAQKIVDPTLSASLRKSAADDFGAYVREQKMKYAPTIIIVDIIDKDGLVVASTDKDRIGTDEHEEEVKNQAHYFSKTITANFGEVFARSVIFEEDETTEPMFHMTTRLTRPKLDAEGKPVLLPAVLLVHFISLPNLAGFLKGDTSSLSGTFETLNTYLVNKDRIIVTPTRGVENTAKKQVISTRPVAECLVNKKEVAEEYIDWRGVPVIGVSACFAGDGLVLVNEVETAEAYALFNDLMRKTAIGGTAVLLAVLLSAFVAIRRFLRNLVLVTEAAKQYARGDFSGRVPTVSKDEMGQLATAFNAMLDKIEISQKEVKTSEEKLRNDAIVLEKDLKEHEEQAVFLEQSKKATLNLLEDAWQAKEKLQFESSRLQTIISSIGDALILIDGKYNITLANPKALEVFALPREEVVGKDLRKVIKLIKKKRGELPVEEWPIEEMFLTKQIVIADLEDELSLTTEKRTIALPIALSVAPIEGGTGAVIVVRDVTEDRELDDAKSGFISVASHQLRTPLTTIRWYAEMLLSEDVGVLSKEQRDFLGEIHGGAERLYQTIDLLLGISRVESGKSKTEPVPINLSLFSEEIAHELAPQADEKNLSLKVSPPEGEPVTVVLDLLTLRQVILNLFSNAIRYTNDKGIIEAKWTMGEEGKEVIYSVHDNGIGIPESQRSRIFSKFFRAENALAKVPDGSGLGLALVKELVEAWGGKVWFETAEGQGTTFFFTVPMGEKKTSSQ